MLRNLRNLLLVGISAAHHELVLQRLQHAVCSEPPERESAAKEAGLLLLLPFCFEAGSHCGARADFEQASASRGLGFQTRTTSPASVLLLFTSSLLAHTEFSFLLYSVDLLHSTTVVPFLPFPQTLQSSELLGAGTW